MTRGFSEDRDSAGAAISLAGENPGGAACLLLEAARSIVHDTRNRLTGISLCIGAVSKRGQTDSNVLAASLASMEQSVRSLEGLCAEFAGIEGAMNVEAAALPSLEIASWYASFLERLGLGVNPLEVDPSFHVASVARGVLSRVLIHLAWVLYGLRASDITIRGRGGRGSTCLALSFRSAYSPAAAGAAPAMNRARGLVESAGGAMAFTQDDDRPEIRIVFARQPLS